MENDCRDGHDDSDPPVGPRSQNNRMMKLSEAESGSRRKSVAAWGKQSAESMPPQDADQHRSGGWFWFLVPFFCLGIGVVLAVSLGLFDRGPAGPQSPTTRAIPAAYRADRAMDYLVQLCELGPRPSGTRAMQRQQQLLQNLFRQQGAEVSMQTFEVRHPEDGSPVPMANLIARFHPNRPKRFLLCAHYDTRPYPDQDQGYENGQ